MIWAVLLLLGIPLWLIAVALVLLLHGRRQVRGLPGAVRCKPRLVSGELPGLKPELARFSSIGLWVHDVLVLYGGNPFLTRVTPFGVVRLRGEPADVDPGSAKGMDDPVAVRFRHDSGATFELVCPRSSLAAAMGPFGTAVSARGPATEP